MEYVIETFSLTKIFSDWWGRSKVCAVDNLNLKILNNEVFGLLGPNGSGKTTTIKLLLGLLHPTKGRSLIFGGDSRDPKINARIGFLPEESYLYRYLNARETLDFYGRLFDIPSEVRRIRIEALLDMVGLKAVANRAVGTYSKGMARRIGLAAALINDPDLLILDEPTTGLDPIGTRQIKDLILAMAKRGKTILLCSHLLADVEDVCDRIAILYGGKIQIEGKVKELLVRSDKRQITTGLVSDATIGKIKQLLDAAKTEYSVDSPLDKLETFFIRTVSAAQSACGGTISGAVSTTKLGDFLVGRPGADYKADVIGQLVSEKVAKKPAQGASSAESAAIRRPVKEPIDEHLLGDLVKPHRAVKPVPVVKENKADEQAKNVEQISKSILDELTGSSDAPDNKERKADRQQGE
jgi:ABC-2 type transport system ATP-binding protein